MNLYVTEKFNVNNSFDKKVLIEEIKRKIQLILYAKLISYFQKNFMNIPIFYMI